LMVAWRVHAWTGGHLPPLCFFLIGNDEGDSKKRISLFIYFIFVLLIFLFRFLLDQNEIMRHERCLQAASFSFTIMFRWVFEK
jgi:hypothetical protein